VTAIDIVGVSKRFDLRADRADSLKELFLRRGQGQAKEFWALRDVSFEIPRGSFFGIIGHNGSGKSTLLRLIAGIHRPTAGTIGVAGRISALLELGSGFHPDLTGRENIYLNGAMLGLNRSEMTRAMDDIIEFSGIGQFVDAPVKVYSSGMSVRLGFAIAVHVQPEILLVDEVLAVGDEEFQRKCFDHIYALRRKGTTIVLVSHDSGTMEVLCDQVAWLDHGELQKVGNPSDVIEGYLSRVNQQENDRLLAEPTSSTVDVDTTDGSRRGSGEVRVVDVTYHNADASPRHSGSSGDPLIIRLHYRAMTEIESPVFGIAIHHENGTHISGTNSKMFGVHQPVLRPGVGHVDVAVDRLVLLPGKYFVTTNVATDDLLHCYDSWDHAKRLIIQPGSSDERFGLVEMGVRWSLVELD
jgi:lipopolysaccharide transport system ATP-binding protein